MKAQGHITVRRRPKDGDNGSNAFRLDLNNENDSLLYDAEGNLLSGSVVSVATLYDGDAAVSSGVVFAISERVGCSAAQATISGNTITVSGLSGNGYVMVTATYNNRTYSAKFTLKRIVGTVKYDLLVSPDAIGYNSTTGVKTSSTINVKVFRTAQNNSGGATRALITAIPTGYTLKVDGTDVSSGYGSSGYTFNVDVTKSSHVVTLLQGTTTADEETIPIGKVEDGEDGKNALRLDLNNENDSLLYDAEGNLLSGSVVTVATLYNGDAVVSSGVTYAISERSGMTSSQATISGNTVTVSGISSSGYVMVKATYGGKDYYAKFSLKRIVGSVKYDLLVTPDAIAYNTTTGTKSASQINVKIYRTAQNNSGGVTRSLMTSIPTGYSLKVDGTNVSNYGSSGYTFNVDTSQNSHIISLYQSTTLIDEETVPINKSTNGTDGDDGDDGEDGISTINYYKWGTTKPTKPSDSSLNGSGALPCPSGWSTQCEDRLQYLNPNSSTYQNWTAQSDGTRKMVANTTGTFKQAELIKVVLPASGKIDIRAAILSEANYDFIYVSPLFSTEAAAKTDLTNFLSVCYRYSAIENNGYDPTRAIKALGYTTLAQGTISTQNNSTLGTYYLYVAYVKDSNDSSSPSGWTGGYAEYATSLGESIIRYAVSGTGVLTHSGSTYTFSDIAWSDVFAYANDGPVGLTYRTSSWASGVEYRNDAGRSGEPRYIDICFNMPVSMIGETGFEAYKCTRTHISDSTNIPLGASGYWEKINNMQPIITALVLAAKIRADYIDVGSIAADQAFIQTLNAQSLNAKTVNTVETGNGHITMEDDGLRMFTPSGEERLLISGDALSYLSSASSTGPSSNVLASLSANVGHTTGDYAQSSQTKTIQTLTINEKRIVSLPARTISINGGFVDDSPSLVTSQPVFMMIWAKWLVDGTAIATVSKQITCCSDGMSYPFSFNTSMALPACNASVAAGSHTIAIEFDVEFYNTNNGIISGNYFGLYMSNTVTANSILWSSSVMKTEIASDGFRSALSADVYVLVQLSGSTNNIEFRNQNYGIRIRSDGIYATKTGANGWTNVTSKLLP